MSSNFSNKGSTENMQILGAEDLAALSKNTYPGQWHIDQEPSLSGLEYGANVRQAWNDGYDGEGIRIAVVDNGVQLNHPEFSGRIDYSASNDFRNNNLLYESSNPFYVNGGQPGDPVLKEDSHGTSVAGLIGAAADGKGTTGIAYNSTLASFRLLAEIEDDSRVDSLYDDILDELKATLDEDIDISSNSWGFPGGLGILNFEELPELSSIYQDLMDEGRDGLGTIMAYAAGNSRGEGDWAGNDGWTSNRFNIVVGATVGNGSNAIYSTPGASLLISAPAGNFDETTITTTDKSGGNWGDGYTTDSNYTYFNGTSAATPIVSGASALMLNANKNLGYRDIQEILAYSARRVDLGLNYDQSLELGWELNGAKNWNGGGMLVSENLGMGLLDATTAVRLAETWYDQGISSGLSIGGKKLSDGSSIDDYYDALTGKTKENKEITKAFSSEEIIAANERIFDGDSRISYIDVPNSERIDIQQIEVKIDGLKHESAGDIAVLLISPDGTVSTLLNVPDGGYYAYEYPSNFPLTSTQHWAENGAGRWHLVVFDLIQNAQAADWNGKWSLNLYGDASTEDNIWIYTNDYALDFENITMSDNGIQGISAEQRRILSDSDGGIDTINAASIHIDNIDVQGKTIDGISRVNSTTVNSFIDLSGHTQGNLAGKDFYVNYNPSSNEVIENALTGDGDDLIVQNAASNKIDGGRGLDTVSYQHAEKSIQVNLEKNENLPRFEKASVNATGDGNDVLIRIENINGSAFNDIILGNSQNNKLDGGAGDDSIDGKLGDNILIGGLGDDKLFSGENNDLYIGLSGKDIISDRGGSDILILDDLSINELFAGNDFLKTFGKSLILKADSDNEITIENMFISEISAQAILNNPNLAVDNADKGAIEELRFMDGSAMIGKMGIDSLIASMNGNNLLIGASGDDEIIGNTGTDRLYGGNGDDEIFGNNGNDLINGGTGQDRLEGGAGNDSYFFLKSQSMVVDEFDFVNDIEGYDNAIMYDYSRNDILNWRALDGNDNGEQFDALQLNLNDGRTILIDNFFIDGNTALLSDGTIEQFEFNDSIIFAREISALLMI